MIGQNDELNVAGKAATKRARELLQSGGVPMVLGVSGLLAVTHERIRQVGATGVDKDAVLDIAAFAICAVSQLEEESEWDKALDNLREDIGATLPPLEIPIVTPPDNRHIPMVTTKPAFPSEEELEDDEEATPDEFSVVIPPGKPMEQTQSRTDNTQITEGG